MTLAIGLDLGGTNLKVVALAVTDGVGELVARDVVPTDRTSPRASVARCADVARRWVARYPAAVGVGLTLPGLFDERGRAIVVPNIPGRWAGVPVHAPVEAAAGVPSVLTNDSDAFALAELRLGAARTARTAVALVLGTGIGGAIVIDGRIHRGGAGIAGLIGHTVVQPHGGSRCGCGGTGCLETVARADVFAGRAGFTDAAAAVRAGNAGHPRAREALLQTADWLAIALGNVLNILGPEIIVVGGGVAQAGEALFDPLRQALRRRAPLVPAAGYRLVGAAFGPWSGAAGAALTVLEAAAGSGA